MDEKQCPACGRWYPEDADFPGGACIPCNEEYAAEQQYLEDLEAQRWAEYAEEERRAGRMD